MKSENCVDGQTIEYTHTSVPASMRSPYWKYFGFPSDSANKILTRQKIICTICGTAISYNKNTSNLRTHLIARHPEQLHQLYKQQQQQSSAFSSRMSIDSDGVPTEVQSRIYEDNIGEQKRNTNKRAPSADKTVESVIKIRLLNTPRQEGNNSEDSFDGKVKRIHSEDLKVCLEEYHCQSVERGAQPLVKKNFCNEEHESIIVNENDYMLLGSEPINDIQKGEVEHINKTCTNVYNGDNTDNDVDEFMDGETVMLDSEITQKSMFDYSSEISATPPEQQNKSTVLVKKTSHIEFLADMLVKDMLPFNVLQGIGFKQFLNSIDVANVDTYAVEKKIQSDFSQMQNIIKKYITTKLRQQDKPYSLSIETYINIEGENIFSVYVNFLNFDFDYKLESILYDEIVCKKETELYDILQDFDLSRCSAILTTNIDNLIIQHFCMTHGIEAVPCLDALLARCVNLIFEQDVISELFYRIRKLCQNPHLTTLNPNCPWSKLKLVQDFVDNSLATDMDSMISNISPDLESFMTYMSPLKITFDTINAEPLPLCTLVRPLMMKLFEEHFYEFNTDVNVYIQAAQKVINNELRSSIEKCQFFSEAVLFDGRFQRDFIQPGRQLTHSEQQKQNASLDGYNRSEVVAAVCQRFQHLILTPSFDIKTEQKEKCDAPQIVPRSSLRLFFHRISDAANRKNTTNTFSKVSQHKDPIDLEFIRYNCEPSLDLEQCPIDWWQSQSKQYKILYKLSNYYLCVPCYAVRWRIISADNEVEMEDRNVWLQKRRTLRYQQPVERCLWYLHYNRLLYDKIKTKSPLIQRKNK